MKPILLKIMGINSFDTEQEIDFSKLMASGGIFGIFGDTGTGKSTIIDSITLALYGKIVRHKSKSKNGDFINLNRKDAKVEFTFSIQESGFKKQFSVSRQFKKDKEGGVKSHLVRLVDLDNEQILADKKTDLDECIINLIGLNYEDFIRAVVLPQGKFSEFLMLENIEKRKMLERIFGLEKYGERLTRKINELKTKKQREVEKINEKIGLYENLCPEILQQKRDILNQEKDILNKTEERLIYILNQEEFLKQNYQLKKEYTNYDIKLNELLQYKDMVFEMQQKLENSQKANILKPFVLEINQIRQDLELLQTDHNNLNFEYTSLQQQFEIYDKKFKEATEIYRTQIPELEKMKFQLENCIRWEKQRDMVKKEIELLNKNVFKFETDIKNFRVDFKNIGKNKEQIKQNIKDLESFAKKNKIDINFKEKIEDGIEILKEVTHIDSIINSNSNKIKELYKDSIKIKQEIKSIQENKEYFNSEIESILISNKFNFEKQILNFQKSIEDFENSIKNLDSEIETLENQIKLQENKEFVKDLIQALKTGKECPICGSKDHPNPAQIFLETMLQTLVQKRENLFVQKSKFQEQKLILHKKDTIIKKYILDIENYLKNFNFQQSTLNINDEHIFKAEEIFTEVGYLENKINFINQKLSTYFANLHNFNNLTSQLDDENKKYFEKKERLLCLLEKIKTELKISDFYKEKENLLNLERELDLKFTQLSSFRENLEKILLDEKKIEGNILQVEKEILSSKTSLCEKNELFNSISKNIEHNSCGKDFSVHILEISKKINKIINDEKSIKKEYEKICINITQVKLNFETVKTKIEIKNQENLKKSIKLQSMLEQNEFLENNVLKYALSNQEEIKLTSKIASFKEKNDDFQVNLKRIREKFFKLNNIHIEKVDILLLQNDIDKISMDKTFSEKLRKETISNIAKLDFEINEIEKALILTTDLQKELNKKLKKLGLLEEISKLNKGGLFVEYIANHQLKQIIFEASKRLNLMTLSKYSLELIDNEFMIKDNFNGGIIRSVRSLSGGEIFMASLSLALALSNKIQLKNKAPLEVFFLDEGFGTLDGNTLDTVINTLEQLQTDNIGVGVITHIEEIKNRVQNKLIVKNNLDNFFGAKVYLD